MGKVHAALNKAVPGSGKAAALRSAAPAAAAPAGGSGALAQVAAAARGVEDPHVVAASHPKSEVAAQFRELRDRVLELSRANGWRAFVLTSAAPGDGTSVTAANLACAFAERTDVKTVLLDADLRRPRQHAFFAVDNQRGAADYLAGGSMLEMALQRSRLGNLWVLPAGRTSAQPAELLSGKRVDDLIARLRRDFDLVLIDAPAATNAAEAALVAPRADATLLVVRTERTRREDASHAVQLLRNAQANVVGTVVAGVVA